MEDVASFDAPSDTEDALDEIIITPAISDFHQVYSYLHPSKSSPITFCDNSIPMNDSVPLATSYEINCENSTISTVLPSHFSNQLTTECCNTSKNSKSRRMEYSMRCTRTYSNSSSSCNPSQDSAFGSMTDGELSIASSSLKMSSFQSMSSPIDESVEDSSDLTLSKKSSITISTSTSGLFVEPPTILVNDKNSFYTTSPAKSFDMTQTFSQKYRVSSFEDMSTKRSFLKNVHKQNFRSLEEERRIDSAFTPVVKPALSYNHNLDANFHRNINSTEKFKKLTHVSFASKVSTRERHAIWKNSILSKGILMKSNDSLNDSSNPDSFNVNNKLLKQEFVYAETSKNFTRVKSTNELSSSNRFDCDARSSISEISTLSEKSNSERHLLNLITLKQSTIGNDCDELKEELTTKTSENLNTYNEAHGPGGGYSKRTARTMEIENNSTDSSASHRSMCRIIGGVDSEVNHIEDKIPLLDGMEMSPISPVENDEIL